MQIQHEKHQNIILNFRLIQCVPKYLMLVKLFKCFSIRILIPLGFHKYAFVVRTDKIFDKDPHILSLK